MTEQFPLAVTYLAAEPQRREQRPLPVLWRDPHAVAPEQLARTIAELEKACEEQPRSVELRTCLGMALAMNYEIYRSCDAFEDALRVDSTNFLAQLKYGELHYRLRALARAEEETVKALELASNNWELAAARKQLQEIRTLGKGGILRPVLDKALGWRGVALAVGMIVAGLVAGYR